MELSQDTQEAMVIDLMRDSIKKQVHGGRSVDELIEQMTTHYGIQGARVDSDEHVRRLATCLADGTQITDPEDRAICLCIFRVGLRAWTKRHPGLLVSDQIVTYYGSTGTALYSDAQLRVLALTLTETSCA